jgi:CubicO group peptidase (beta-lactamase class C family)
MPAFDDFLDWETITARVAAEPHWFGGERRIAYTPVNTGFILGEVMRRVDGRTPGQFFQDEIAGPAAIDLQIGVRERETLARVAETGMLAPPASWPTLEPLAMRIAMCVPMGDWTRWEALHSEWPSGNGFTNGPALARLGTILTDGGVLDGRRYLSEAMAREAVTAQVEGEDPIFGHMRISLGFSLHADYFPLPSPTTVYWGGRGGALCIMDPKTGLSFGYAMNNFVPTSHHESPRVERFFAALAEVLAALEAGEAVA